MTLFDPQGREIDQPDIHDPQGVSSADAELLARMVEEIRALVDAHEPMVIGLNPVSVVQLAGLLQLALRHAGITDELRAPAERFLDGARAYFANCPAVLEVLARGDDPIQDMPR